MNSLDADIAKCLLTLVACIIAIVGFTLWITRPLPPETKPNDAHPDGEK